MSFLTDVDIQRILGRSIVIEPFNKKNLSSVGYDFSVGTFVFSLKEGLLQAKNRVYSVAPGDTIQILTKESLWVSNQIAGTLHSRVLLVSRGFSHISTTLDPGWYGPLLVTMTNLSDSKLYLDEGMTFFTVVFYKVHTPTRFVGRNFSFIKRILTNQANNLNNNTKAYVQHVAKIVGDGEIAKIFTEKVEKANKPMPNKVLSSIRNAKILRIGELLFRVTLIGSIIALLLLQTYWDNIKFLFHNVNYDTAIFVGQILAVIGLASLLISRFKK